MTIPRQQWWSGVIVLLALGLGTAVNKRLPDPDEIRQEPFYREVSRGATVSLRTGRVNVLGVDAAPSLKNDTRDLAIASKDAVFVVLDVEYMTWKRPGTLASIFIESQDGRRFGGLPPVGTGGCGVAQPGIPIRCQVVVEVAREALPGAVALLTEDADWKGWWDDVARIDLRIDEALARELQGRQRPIQVRTLAQVQETGTGGTK